MRMGKHVGVDIFCVGVGALKKQYTPRLKLSSVMDY